MSSGEIVGVSAFVSVAAYAVWLVVDEIRTRIGIRRWDKMTNAERKILAEGQRGFEVVAKETKETQRFDVMPPPK